LSPRGISKGVEDQREVAEAKLAGPLLVCDADCRQLLEQQGDVNGLDIGPDGARSPCALEQLHAEILGFLAVSVHLVRGGEGPRQAKHKRVRVGVHDAAHEANEGVPRVVLLGQRSLGLGDVLPLAFGAEPPKEVLLAPVAAVQCADAHASPRGHRSDRGTRICDKHLSRSVEDAPVVAGRFSPPAAQGRSDFFSMHHIIYGIVERTIPFRYTTGTERFVP
jgi:hypothetical protein